MVMSQGDYDSLCIIETRLKAVLPLQHGQIGHDCPALPT